MILSNEPGFYLPGQYGIRIENLLLTREAERQPDQSAVSRLRDPDPRPL
jgi:Xaa-Pro aminopeptidase